ncbi:MAG: hydrolase [Acidobacteria bacterium]|nr:hydrolase [Acidobacteriota bacterium]
MLKAWLHEDRELIADMGVFQLYRVRARSPRTGQYRRLSVLHAGSWVNVVALTPDRQVLLIRQFRHGTGEFTLEIPGGMVDPDEMPAQAAMRELLEETGYAGDPPVSIGVVTPNPAILNNRCHTFLIENCRWSREPELDSGEDIEVMTRPLQDVPGIIAAGDINHALVISAFWWLSQKHPGLLHP